MSDEKYLLETRTNPTWHLPAIVVLGFIALGGLGLAWSNSSKMESTKAAVAEQLKTQQQAVQQDLTGLKERIAQDEKTNTDLQGDLKVVTDKLKITQGQLKKARQEATEWNTTATETKEKLTALDTSVHTELATKATTDDVKTVDTRVTQVNSDLNKTISDLN